MRFLCIRQIHTGETYAHIKSCCRILLLIHLFRDPQIAGTQRNRRIDRMSVNSFIERTHGHFRLHRIIKKERQQEHAMKTIQIAHFTYVQIIPLVIDYMHHIAIDISAAMRYNYYFFIRWLFDFTFSDDYFHTFCVCVCVLVQHALKPLQW